MSRPRSPHLTKYKPQVTSGLSILLRLTGIALAIGSIALAWWVVAAAVGGTTYANTTAVYTSIIGQITVVTGSGFICGRVSAFRSLS